MDGCAPTFFYIIWLREEGGARCLYLLQDPSLFCCVLKSFYKAHDHNHRYTVFRAETALSFAGHRLGTIKEMMRIHVRGEDLFYVVRRLSNQSRTCVYTASP